MLDRNWRCDEGELDLVVRRGGLIVFCEVKARATTRHGYASGAVYARKQRKLRTLAARWLAAHRATRRSAIRFDVAAIVGTHVDVIESAF